MEFYNYLTTIQNLEISFFACKSPAEVQKFWEENRVTYLQYTQYIGEFQSLPGFSNWIQSMVYRIKNIEQIIDLEVHKFPIW